METAMNDIAIKTAGLTKQFGTFNAVTGLNLNVAKGSVCGFLGKNGAGKTTTIKMLVGLTKPTSGTIFLSGKQRKNGKNDNAHIGYLPDVPNFYGYMSAREYLEFCGKLYGVGDNTLKTRIDDKLGQVGLKDAKKPISAYSRGMKQRLGIAQALINEPDIIFMDEPVSALDPIGRHEIMGIIRSLRGSTTIFFSTHILADVESTCDYALILEKGKLLAADTIANLKQSHSKNAAVMRLFSPNESNKLLAILQKNNSISAEAISATELLLRADNIHALSKNILPLLIESDVSFESFNAYTPSLEDIFMEVTANE